MMPDETAIREAVRREVAPLLEQCVAALAELDDLERTLPELSDLHARAAARVDLILRRANLDALMSGLQDAEERVMRVAKQRWWWRI